MRLWSIHPHYLDTKGLVALWRESLLAKKVLTNKTRGYRNHPQLIRFKNTENPPKIMDYYLAEIYREAKKRGYKFNKRKIQYFIDEIPPLLKVSSGQIEFELKHLLNKIKNRDFLHYIKISHLRKIIPHPLFSVYDGPVEPWEKHRFTSKS